MTARDATTHADDATDEVAADTVEPTADAAGPTAGAAEPTANAEAVEVGDAEPAGDAGPAATTGELEQAEDEQAAAEAEKTAKAGRTRGLQAGTRRARRRGAGADTEPARPRRRWPLVAALVVAALFAGAMVTLFVVTRPDPIAGLSRTQQDAVTAAGQAAVNLQTFRRASFDEDFANALASLTPQFAQEQLAPRKDALQKQLTDGGRDATARALSSALVSSTATQAVVLVVTNTTQTADDGTSTPFVFSRLQLSLQLVDGKWLVSDLKSVGLS